MNSKEFFNRESKTMVFGSSLFFGLGLWFNHYIAFGTLNFFDSFPSHESTGLLLVLFGFYGIFFQMFDYSLPDWLREKNNKKIIGKIINKIIKK